MFKNLQVALFAFTLLFGSFAMASERAEQGWQLIEQGALIVDVRTPQEFVEGHLDNALNFPLHELDKHFSSIDKGSVIVLYCRSGNRSGQAFNYLREQGFTHLHNAGGLQEMQVSR